MRWTVYVHVALCFFITLTLATQQQSDGSDSFSSSTVHFCNANLYLAVGDNFNIRDFVVDSEEPSIPVNWSDVSFYSQSGWHITDFNSGQNVKIDVNDLTTNNYYEIFVRGGSAPEMVSSCKIRVQLSNSQLLPAALDSQCGMARGSIMSEINTQEVDTTPGGSILKFCVYSLTLTVGDVFNIRDAVVYSLSATKKIDWTNVVFYYPDVTNWHINEFATGTPFIIKKSDFGKGNRGANQFSVAMRDFNGASDHRLIIMLTMNASLSGLRSFMRNSECGYARDKVAAPDELNQRYYPAISTVSFDFEGPPLSTLQLTTQNSTGLATNSSFTIANYVADLLGIPPAWVVDCLQKVVNFECVQFIDTPINESQFDTRLWASRMLEYVNNPLSTDTRASEWKYFSKANVTGYSSLSNFQPLAYEVGVDSSEVSTNARSLSLGLVLIGLMVVALILGVIAIFVWKVKQRAAQRI